MRNILALSAFLLALSLQPAAAQTSAVSTNLVTVQSAATTNATSTKALPGQLYGFTLCNTSAAVKFFKFYNKASAPTVGTDTVAFKILIAAGSCRDREFPLGMNFSLGIAWAITGAQADSDATAVAAGDVVGAFDYK
jgi:hypothetical protein